MSTFTASVLSESRAVTQGRRPLVRVIRIGDARARPGIRPWCAIPSRFSWPFHVMPRPMVAQRHSWAEAMLDAQHMIHRLEVAQLAQLRASRSQETPI